MTMMTMTIITIKRTKNSSRRGQELNHLSLPGAVVTTISDFLKDQKRDQRRRSNGMQKKAKG